MGSQAGRFKHQRDENERPIFWALKAAGADPRRGTEVDIYAKHKDGYGVMLEVKMPHSRINFRPIQIWMQEVFKDRYFVVTSVDQALRACGRI